jgi:hypothetical protein
LKGGIAVLRYLRTTSGFVLLVVGLAALASTGCHSAADEVQGTLVGVWKANDSNSPETIEFTQSGVMKEYLPLNVDKSGNFALNCTILNAYSIDDYSSSFTDATGRTLSAGTYIREHQTEKSASCGKVSPYTDAVSKVDVVDANHIIIEGMDFVRSN